MLLKYRSQYDAKHMMPNLSVFFLNFLFLRGRCCCAQLDLMDLEKTLSAHVACSMKEGRPPKITSY